MSSLSLYKEGVPFLEGSVFLLEVMCNRLPGAGACGADVVPTGELGHTNPAGSSGVSDTVALNLEVNTSALNINDQITPEDTPRPGGFPSDAPHNPGGFPEEDTPRPRDFLDLVDSVTDWNATPTRPRMFPHKLF